MANRNRPSMADVANEVSKVGRADRSEKQRRNNTPSPEDYWKKYTVPFRQEQLERLEAILAMWVAERGVKVTAAETLRLALEKLLDKMEANPDDVIRELYEQEQREREDMPSRKYGPSKGAEAYLRDRDLI